MALLKNLMAGLRGLLRKEQMEREMDEELGEFLDAATKEKMRGGMSREEAVRAARIEMGGVEAVKEEVRAASWESRIETVWSDLRFGARLLRLNPVFAGAAILSLALGIGANTAIFQLLDAVRLRTLPVKNPQELASVAIDHRKGASGHFTSRYSDLTYAMWQQIHSEQQGFSNSFAWVPLSSIFRLPVKFALCKDSGSAGGSSRPWASSPHLAACSFPRTIRRNALQPE